MKNSALEAVKLGILRVASKGHPYPGKHGNYKPYVVDSRGAGTNIELRTLILNEMQCALLELTPYDVIGGIAKSGIMWGSMLAQILQQPYATILPDEPRKSGLQRQIEGDVVGANVVLIDNWSRTGRTIEAATKKVFDAGGKVSGVILISCPNALEVEITHCKVIWTLPELIEAQSYI